MTCCSRKKKFMSSYTTATMIFFPLRKQSQYVLFSSDFTGVNFLLRSLALRKSECQKKKSNIFQSCIPERKKNQHQLTPQGGKKVSEFTQQCRQWPLRSSNNRCKLYSHLIGLQACVDICSLQGSEFFSPFSNFRAKN